MQHSNLDQLPSLRVGIGDLRTLENILQGYSAFLRKQNGAHPSPKHSEQIRTLDSIRQRLRTLLLSPQPIDGIRIPFTGREFKAMDSALAGFVKLIPRIVPYSRERDETLQAVEVLRQHLTLFFRQAVS